MERNFGDILDSDSRGGEFSPLSKPVLDRLSFGERRESRHLVPKTGGNLSRGNALGKKALLSRCRREIRGIYSESVRKISFGWKLSRIPGEA